VTLKTAEWRLAVLWLAGAGVLFLVLIVQSVVDYYEPLTEQAWGWFLPTVMPTLALIVGTLVAEAGEPESGGRLIDPRLFRLGLALSVAYLLAVAASILAAPLVAARITPVELMQRSNLWLGPLQGLVAGTLGVFYRRTVKP
jgi:hypothetical protein